MKSKKLYQTPKIDVCRIASTGTILWASWDKPQPGPARRVEVF